MDVRPRLLFFVFDFILPLAIGYALREGAGTKSEVFDRLMIIAVVSVAPVMAVLSLWVIHLKLSLLWMPVLGVAMQMVPGLIGVVRGKKFTNALERGSFVLSAMLSNRGVVGMLSLFILYGEQGYAYMRLTILFAPIVVYLICFPMAGRYERGARPVPRKRVGLVRVLFNPNYVPGVGVVIGFALNLMGVERPAVLGEVFPYMVHLTAWVFLIPIGASIELREMNRYWRSVSELLLLKFILNPLIITLLALLVGLRGKELVSVGVLASTPTAIFAPVTAKLFRLNVHLAMSAFVLTTVVYLVAVLPPILLLFGHF